jgi:hypothetical protein
MLSGTYAILPVNVSYISVVDNAVAAATTAERLGSGRSRRLQTGSVTVTFEIFFLVPLLVGATDPYSQVTVYYQHLNTQLVNSVTQSNFDRTFFLYCKATHNCTALNLVATALPTNSLPVLSTPVPTHAPTTKVVTDTAFFDQPMNVVGVSVGVSLGVVILLLIVFFYFTRAAEPAKRQETFLTRWLHSFKVYHGYSPDGIDMKTRDTPFGYNRDSSAYLERESYSAGAMGDIYVQALEVPFPAPLLQSLSSGKTISNDGVPGEWHWNRRSGEIIPAPELLMDPAAAEAEVSLYGNYSDVTRPSQMLQEEENPMQHSEAHDSTFE